MDSARSVLLLNVLRLSVRLLTVAGRLLVVAWLWLLVVGWRVGCLTELLLAGGTCSLDDDCARLLVHLHLLHVHHSSALSCACGSNHNGQ